MDIEQHILEIIEQGSSDGNLYFLPDQQLDRKTYLAVNKVLECLGGRWNRKLKAHVFETGISNAIDDTLLTGEVIDKKREFQFFETPQNTVAQLIELAEIQIGHSCLEPSAGCGNIAEALSGFAGIGKVMCVELDPESVKTLIGKGFSVHEGDFLQYETKCVYDRIVMNPPFTRQQDIAHVLKALSLLKDGGILVSVMSAGVMFRQDKRARNFWARVAEHPSEVIELPPGGFKVSGTMVNTVILKVVMEK